MPSDHSTRNTFIFAAVTCIICSFLLTAAATGLRPFQEKNELIDQQRNILKALGVISPEEKVPALRIESLYAERVENRFVDSEGNILADSTGASQPVYPIYIVRSGEEIDKYAIPIEGKGLWSTIYGYLAIDGDGTTIVGVSVYKHGETPGLGGEVEKAWFQDQFKGKKIVNNEGQFVSVGIVKGQVNDVIPPAQHDYYVDGISGATITSRGMSDFLEEDLMKYEPFARKLR